MSKQTQVLPAEEATKKVEDTSKPFGFHAFKHDKCVNSVSFSNDGRLLATGDFANKTTIYMPQFARPDEILLSSIKSLTMQKSMLLYRPCPTTRTTFLHRCVNQGDANLLNDISGSIVMKTDIDGKSPLDIAIEQKSHQKCLLLTKACLSMPNNYSHEVLVQSIPTLLKEKYHDVVECIFHHIMKKTDTSKLERFALPQPLFYKSPGYGAEKLFEGKTKSNIVEVQTYRIILQSLFKKNTLIEVLENASLKTFETKAMQYIVTYLWQRLLPYYFFQSMLYLVAVFCFTFGHFCELFPPTTIWYQMYWYFLLASGILISVFVGFECRHLKRRGLKKHFKSGWNLYEVLTYTTALGSIVTKLLFPLPHQEILDATGLILLWIGIFNKIRGFEKFSVLITTFTQILYDIRYFTLMLSILICAFAMAFKLLVRGEDIFDNVVAIESTYNLMFGLTELEFFVEYDDNAISIAARVFVAFFLFLVVIVMLNMLIAIMADSFDNVQENLKIQSFRAKARVCADLLIDFHASHKLFAQEYLHICTVKDEAGESALMSNQSHWEGRLKAVKREIITVKKDITKNQAEMKAEMGAMKAEMKAEMGAMNAKISGLESKIDQLLEAIMKKK